MPRFRLVVVFLVFSLIVPAVFTVVIALAVLLVVDFVVVIIIVVVDVVGFFGVHGGQAVPGVGFVFSRFGGG